MGEIGEVGVKERVQSVLHYKKPAFVITMIAVMACVLVAICFLTNPSQEYQVRITIPAGSTEAFCYSDEEISPKSNTLKIANGDNLGDTAVLLLPVEVKEENAYEAVYMTPGMPVNIDVEKGAWFKIGVNMQNPTTEDIDVYVSVRNVEIRIAEIEDSSENIDGAAKESSADEHPEKGTDADNDTGADTGTYTGTGADTVTPSESEIVTYWQEKVEDYEVSLQGGRVENTLEVVIHKGDKEWSILSYATTDGYRVPEDITMDTFEGIMGQNGFRIYECYDMGSELLVCTTDYYAVREEPVHLGNSWTTLKSREEEKTPNVYEADLDGDGITELLCNVQWLADGALDTQIYHWDGKQVYTFGGTDVMMAENPNIQVYGVGSVGAEYLPEKNKILAWYWDEATQGFVEKEYEIDMDKVEMWEKR